MRSKEELAAMNRERVKRWRTKASNAWTAKVKHRDYMRAWRKAKAT